MKFERCIALLLIGVIGVCYAQDFYLVTPSALRLNSDEKIAVAIDGKYSAPVSITVQDHPRRKKTIFQGNFQVQPGKPELFKFNLEASKFPPDFLSAPGSPKLVTLSVRVHNTQKDVQIPISSQSGYVFIQSDKPIYTPLDRASFRIITLTEEGLPSAERFQLQIKNPDDIVVVEKTFNRVAKQDLVRVANSFARYSYTFPSFPVLGEWSAIVNYGTNLEQNSTIQFELQEYVLPTFVIKLETPDAILPSSDVITVKVEAEYVYKKKVPGIVTFRLGVMREHTSDVLFFATIKPKPLVKGVAQMRISTADLKVRKDIGWFPGIEGSLLVVEATVVDDATGNKRIEVDSSTRFSVSPFIISFKRCLKDFKPGLTSVFEADITYFDGRPASGISTKIKAVADNGKQLNADQSISKSDENGKVTFVIHPEIHHKTVTLTLETNDPLYAGSQAKGIYIQQAYQSKNNAYIAISRSSPERLEPDDMFERDIHFEPKGIQNIYYLVVAKGKIQSMKKTKEGAFKVTRIEFPITYDMVPSFRVVIFAHYGNDLVADSLKIDVSNVCGPEARVSIHPEFEQEEPGSPGKITLRGTKGTLVGLLGVDEAVYALSRKDLLTKEKMFDTLASHDMGCGPGGGININSVLGNAGIMVTTNRFTSSHFHSCTEVKRQKRAIAEEIVSNYTERAQMCCGLGMRPDPYYRSCEEIAESAQDSLNAIHENCTEIFIECCLSGEENDVIGSVYIMGRLVGEKHDGLKFLDPDKIDLFERQTLIRKEFRETWIDANFEIRADNKEVIDVSLPLSITTWVLQAVSVSPTHGICVAEPKTVVSMKKIFLHLNLPYSIKINEQVEVQGTVFNYGSKKIVAYVHMYGVEGLCSGTEPGAKSKEKIIYVDGYSATTVTFSLIPLKIEDIPIRFAVVSSEGSDVIEKKLHVVSGAVREEVNTLVRLDPRNQQKRKRRHIETNLYSDIIDSSQNIQVVTFKLDPPNGTLPGSAFCSVKAIGDVAGPVVETTLSNPDSLLQRPHGCGEQNMMYLAPTLYTMRYLKSTGRLNNAKEEKGKEFIRHGYDNELKYRKADGSYSVWAHTPTSTWLTAFVMKVFCQATEFIHIDKNVISSGINWLIRNQEVDGSFIEKHIMYHRDMMGGVDGAISMTAFALITLEECKMEDPNLLLAKKRAADYLEKRVNTVQAPLPAAIVAYALALSDSAEKQAANEKLIAMSTTNQARNFLYWSTKNSAQDIETAGYGLLTQLLFDDIERSNSIVNYLNTKQLQSGSFKSTQDTVIALQAITEFAIRAKEGVINMISNITISTDKNFHKVLVFNKDNALQLQDVNIENPEGMMFVHTSGYGMGTLTMKLRYDVIRPKSDICKFEIVETLTKVVVLNDMIRGVKKDIDRDPYARRRRELQSDLFLEYSAKDVIRRTKRQNKDVNRDLAYDVKICVKYLGDEETEMSIVDVGVFSGFEPVIKDLEALERNPNHLIQRYEKSKRGIVFYLENIPKEKFYCFSFKVYREYIVGNTQSSTIKVYDYYNPDATCTKFYGPDGNSSLISAICEDDVCECAEGGCPQKDPFTEITKINEKTDRRDKMKTMFCDEFDYVWKGKLQGRMRKEGRFTNITFFVEEVIKAGVEQKIDLENKTRTLRAQEHCRSAQLLSGPTYLILGKDPPPRSSYRYLIDKTSIIHRWTIVDAQNKDPLQIDLNSVTRDLKENGCEL